MHQLQQQQPQPQPQPRPPPGPKLAPPFSTEAGILNEQQIIIPALVHRGKAVVRPGKDINSFLHGELRTHRLNKIHHRLWVAALPVAARSLTRQRQMNRVVLATERPDEHLVWHENRIFVKPLPDYLLCYEFWQKHLCEDADLHRSACGLLLSYMWLIGFTTDFVIATESGLLPGIVDYEKWVRFSKDFLENIDLDTLEQVDPRYHFGELRLSRLNRLVQYTPTPLWTVRGTFDGFMNTSTWYSAFFEKNFGWLVAVFAFVTIILSALQVGLSTDMLHGSPEFQQMSSSLTYLSLAAALAGATLVVAVWAILFLFHVLTTKAFVKRVEAGRNKARLDKA